MGLIPFAQRGLGIETSEKQAPSALDYACQFGLAIATCRKAKIMTFQQALNKVISDFNATVAVRKWRIDTKKKKLISNLLKSPSEFVAILTKHYDRHRHTSSGSLLGREQLHVMLYEVHTSYFLLMHPPASRLQTNDETQVQRNQTKMFKSSVKMFKLRVKC